MPNYPKRARSGPKRPFSGLGRFRPKWPGPHSAPASKFGPARGVTHPGRTKSMAAALWKGRTTRNGRALRPDPPRKWCARGNGHHRGAASSSAMPKSSPESRARGEGGSGARRAELSDAEAVYTHEKTAVSFIGYRQVSWRPTRRGAGGLRRTSPGSLWSWSGAEPDGRTFPPGVLPASRNSAGRHAPHGQLLRGCGGACASAMDPLVHWDTALGAQSRPRRLSV